MPTPTPSGAPDLDDAPADRDRLLADEERERSALAAAFADPDGYCDEILAASMPWGFDPADVRVPVRAWHTTADPVAPVAVLRALVERAGGDVVETPAEGHHPLPHWDDEIADRLRSLAP
jgi:hypothetical protein